MSIFGNVSVADGFDQLEIDFVKSLMASGQVSPEDVANQFNVPLETVLAFAPTTVNESGEGNGLFETLSRGKTLFQSGKQAVDALQQYNILKNTPSVAATAATTMEELAANNPLIIQNFGGASSDGVQVFTETQKAAQMKEAADIFAGNLGSVVGAISGKESGKETAALAVLSSINPAAALAYRLFDAMDFFGGGGLEATPMTAEERADYEAQQKLDFVSNVANLSGEGGDALLSEAIAAAEARGISVDSLLSDLDAGYADLTNTLRTDDGFVAGNAPVFTTGDTQIKNVGDEYYDQFTQEELSAMQAANAAVLDVPLNVAQGALMGTEMLTNVAGADNVASRTLGEWQDVLGGMMSEQSKLDKAEISRIMSEAEGQGWYEEMKAAAEAFGVAPIDFVTNALGTTLPVLAATAVTGGGILPATVVGAATGVGTAKGAIYDATKQEMLNQGVSIEDAERIASDAQSYGGENLGEILISGGFGALAGSTGVEASVSRILQNIGKGGTATVVKGALGEGIGEFGEGGAEQYAANKALQELGLEIDEFQGVVGNAFLEKFAGNVTGGGIAAVEVATEGGTEGIADTNVNSQILQDFNNAYQNELENISGSNVENLASTGLENELNSNELGSSITGTEDTSGAETRDLSTSPKNVNEVTESEISEIESAIEESGLTTTQATGQTTAQQNANTVTGLATVANKATSLFGFGAAAIAAVVYAANKSGASAQDVAAATNLSVDQVNKLANEAGQTINNQGSSTVDVGADTINKVVDGGASKADLAANQTAANEAAKAAADKAAQEAAAAKAAAAKAAADQAAADGAKDAALIKAAAESKAAADKAAADAAAAKAASDKAAADKAAADKAAADAAASTTADTSTATDTSTTTNATTLSDVIANTNAATSITNTVDTSLSTGSDINSTVDSTVSTAINNGVDTNTAVNSSVSSSVSTAINSGVTANTAINTAVNSAINSAANANGNVNSAINSAVNSAITSAVNSGANVNAATNTAVNSAVNAATNAGVNTNTATNIATNAATNANTNINNNVNTNVNTNVNANVNANINTNLNPNVNTNVNSNVNPNVNPNPNLNVNTNVNPNVNPNVNVNTTFNPNINQEVPDPEEEQRQGLMMLIQQTPITESILFEPKFTKLQNVQQGMFDAFLRAAGGNR
jgi:hypothetical protein